MAFKLEKDERQNRIDLSNRLENLIQTPDVEIYNALAVEINAFLVEVTERFQSEYDDKSEKWQDSEIGDNASSLIDEWSNLTLEEDLENNEDYMEFLPDFLEEFNSLSDSIQQ